jgi:hypothetical protein
VLQGAEQLRDEDRADVRARPDQIGKDGGTDQRPAVNVSQALSQVEVRHRQLLRGGLVLPGSKRRSQR